MGVSGFALGAPRLIALFRSTTSAALAAGIKTLVVDALGAPLEAVHRMELAPASVTVVSYFDHPQGDGRMGSLRLYNARPTESAQLTHRPW